MMGGNSFQSCWRLGSEGYAPTRPSWLQASLTELEQKLQSLSLNSNENEDADSFADRAENYYQKRPQLLTLLNDLYRRYISLADRYCLLKNQSQIPTVDEYDDDRQINNSYCHSDYSDDVESSLSFQAPPPNDSRKSPLESEILEKLVGEVIAKSVEQELLVQELSLVEQCENECFRKMDLQRSLLEVLESERLILLSENGRLGFRVSALAEEKKSMVSEMMFLRRKANDLARCVVKMREDHRVCLLSRKIQDMQGQIYGLEKNNREYNQQLLKRDEEEKREAVRDVCFTMDKVRAENGMLQDLLKTRNNKSLQGSHASRWWDRAKNFKVLLCGFVSSPQRCA